MCSSDLLGVKVSARIPGETFDREISGRVKDWHKGDKSPWQVESSWRRQLRYMGAREWARAHAPAIMLGVIADDEADETIAAPRNITPKAPALEIPDDVPDKAPAKPAKKIAKPAKAEKPRPPRRLAVAPVNSIVPWPRGTMTLAASRAVRKPAKAVISQTLR